MGLRSVYCGLDFHHCLKECSQVCCRQMLYQGDGVSGRAQMGCRRELHSTCAGIWLADSCHACLDRSNVGENHSAQTIHRRDKPSPSCTNDMLRSLRSRLKPWHRLRRPHTTDLTSFHRTLLESGCLQSSSAASASLPSPQPSMSGHGLSS